MSPEPVCTPRRCFELTGALQVGFQVGDAKIREGRPSELQPRPGPGENGCPLQIGPAADCCAASAAASPAPAAQIPPRGARALVLCTLLLIRWRALQSSQWGTGSTWGRSFGALGSLVQATAGSRGRQRTNGTNPAGGGGRGEGL